MRGSLPGRPSRGAWLDRARGPRPKKAEPFVMSGERHRQRIRTRRGLAMPWWLDPSQVWRWRCRRLRRGARFDADDKLEAYIHAVMSLRREARDVFLLHRLKAMDYEMIGARLGLTVGQVE